MGEGDEVVFHDELVPKVGWFAEERYDGWM